MLDSIGCELCTVTVLHTFTGNLAFGCCFVCAKGRDTLMMVATMHVDIHEQDIPIISRDVLEEVGGKVAQAPL